MIWILLLVFVVGSALLFGAQPSVELPIRLDAVALYSIAHLALFVGLGTAVTYLRRASD